VLRRIAHEIGRQLAAGTGAERLTARLTSRWASTEAPRGGDVGRWILGAGLVRRGCGLEACESGTTWHTGQPCPVCHDNTLHRLQDAGEQQQFGDQEQHPARAEPPPALSVPRAPAAAAQTWPDLTDTERDQLRAAATPDLIRQSITDYGRSGATYVYGHALVLPHLAEIDPGGNPA
jgi:hypothetical protein